MCGDEVFMTKRPDALTRLSEIEKGGPLMKKSLMLLVVLFIWIRFGVFILCDDRDTG